MQGLSCAFEVRGNQDDLVAKLLAENARLKQAVARHGVFLPADVTPKSRQRPATSPAPTISSMGSRRQGVSSTGSHGHTVSNGTGSPGHTVSNGTGSPGHTVSNGTGSPGHTVSNGTGSDEGHTNAAPTPGSIPPTPNSAEPVPPSSLQPGDAPEAEQAKIMQKLKSTNPQLMHAKYDIDGEDILIRKQTRMHGDTNP